LMFKVKSVSALIALAVLSVGIYALAEREAVLLKQMKDNASAERMSQTELALLGDPLFNLVLKDNADLTNLQKIEELIQPEPKQRSTFVVDENIANPARGQSRRSVFTFSGSNRGESL